MTSGRYPCQPNHRLTQVAMVQFSIIPIDLTISPDFKSICRLKIWALHHQLTHFYFLFISLYFYIIELF